MNHRKLLMIGLAVAVLLLTACQSSPFVSSTTPVANPASNSPEKQRPSASTSNDTVAPKPSKERDMSAIYSLALDVLIEEDPGLNHNMTYIAVDMSGSKDLDQYGKQKILDHLNKYDVDIMQATIKQLMRKGLYDKETHGLDGIALKIKSTEIKDDKVTIQASKFRSGKGAITMTIVVGYKDEKWQITKSGITSIS